MIRLFLILFCLCFSFTPQKDSYFNKQGKPSSYGISTYIKTNEQSLIKEYEFLVDSLYDVYIYTDDLGDNGELGQFYLPDYVVITNREKFIGYELKDLSKFKQRTISFKERTVKSVVFHELTHVYFNQTLITMRNDSMYVSPEYGVLRLFPTPSTRFGSEFIEEGVCEYMIYNLHECPSLGDILIPTTIEQLLDPNNKVEMYYSYSVFFLRDFLDKYGVHRGMEILIGNRPPTYDEILDPKLFFSRLK